MENVGRLNIKLPLGLVWPDKVLLYLIAAASKSVD
jgi:hypothetical protein